MLYFNTKINKLIRWHLKLYEIRNVIFSLIMQTITSQNLKIIYIVTRLTRSIHDQTIFNKFHSEVKLKHSFPFSKIFIFISNNFVFSYFLLLFIIQSWTDFYHVLFPVGILSIWFLLSSLRFVLNFPLYSFLLLYSNLRST